MPRDGYPVRVGRWRIPSRPRAILVEFSELYDRKDDVLAELWESYSVDSISGEWDYVEPVLFGHAAARVIEKWWSEVSGPAHRRTIAQFHEWMTGSGLLYLKSHVNAIGTIFTTHATMLGRALSAQGRTPDDGLGDDTPESLAEAQGVVAKHSLESKCAQAADVFTTVSEITAKEARLLHGREPQPVLPNGIDLSVIDELAPASERSAARQALEATATRFLGEPVGDAAFLCVSGRYEFHNKGIDLLLEALGRMNETDGKPVVLFALVPAGHSGPWVGPEERDSTAEGLEDVLDSTTHKLFALEDDPIAQGCARFGLRNAPGSRVRVLHVPIYLHEADGLWNRTYESVLSCMDLSCFPSYYEPWGYTPQESLAVGVPTITSDYAGFGRWAESEGLGREDGVTVLPRVHRDHEAILADLTGYLEQFLVERPAREAIFDTCRRTAARTAWSDLIANYDAAFEAAHGSVDKRVASGEALSPRSRPSVRLAPSREGRTPQLQPFDVAATLPTELQGLERLSRNFWWAWNPDAERLFAELSPESWEACGHNPVTLLCRVYPEDLERAAKDADYLARLERVLARLDAYMNERPATWTTPSSDGGEARVEATHPVAYFCAEFGLHESFPIYSGGLGILAGDHLKSASDIGLPLVAVGLFYRRGYMTQRMSIAGEQIADDATNDPSRLPVEPVLGDDGQPVRVRLAFPGRDLWVCAWKAQVGRVELFLLDTDVPENREEDRAITHHLYGGDSSDRLKQEIVLGRGGARLLRALSIVPGAFHINEGHAAFSTIERVRYLVLDHGLSFEEAREAVRATTAFTTHTPVPAGHDRFAEDLMRRYFSGTASRLGLSWERFYELGQLGEERGDFNMTHLALNLSTYSNGVSRLHGDASRELLSDVWPSLLTDEIPIDTITNGVHLGSWVAPEISELLVGTRTTDGAAFSKNAKSVDLARLWDAKQTTKGRLAKAVAANLKATFLARHDSPTLLEKLQLGIEENALWIGFARRFAPYKRAHLLFRDRERLRALLSNTERPVRIFVAGKAHPRDQLGQEILSDIFHASRSEDLAGRIFFVENYEMDLARLLVQGVDVWLNNPTRMMEASGTSGMKAAANGGLNLSIGDGWWPEAYDERNGWQIGIGREYEDQDLQDEQDSASLYRLLEEELVPAFFERDASGRPPEWLDRVQAALATIPAQFNTDRMVTEYASKAYGAAAAASKALQARDFALPRSWAREKARLRKSFRELSVVSVDVADMTGLVMGDTVHARVELDLAGLAPGEVVVEMVLGHRRGEGDLTNPRSIPLEPVPVGGGKPGAFFGEARIERSGQYAYGLRVRARSTRDAPDSLREFARWL